MTFIVPIYSNIESRTLSQCPLSGLAPSGYFTPELILTELNYSTTHATCLQALQDWHVKYIFDTSRRGIEHDKMYSRWSSNYQCASPRGPVTLTQHRCEFSRSHELHLSSQARPASPNRQLRREPTSSPKCEREPSYMQYIVAAALHDGTGL
jgi:hypothetical protein